MDAAKIYLIPSLLSEDGVNGISSYVYDAIKQCKIIYAENLRTTRRYFKKLIPHLVIDNYTWVEIGKDEASLKKSFIGHAKANLNIGIVSEAGCPGVADPGQLLVHWAQETGCVIKPLVGPNSMLLALMASGLGGQNFAFSGYLPIELYARKEKIKQLQLLALNEGQTQLFMETPYRNDALFQLLLQQLNTDVLLCVAADLTSDSEYIKTRSVREWKQNVLPQLHKRPCIFLIGRRNSM